MLKCAIDILFFCLLLKNEQQIALTDEDVIKMWFSVPVSSAWNLKLSKDHMENELKPLKPDYLQAQSQTNPKENNHPVWRTFGSLEA